MERNMDCAPHLLRRRRRARLPPPFPADRKSRSGATRPRASRETELPPQSQRQGSDSGKRMTSDELRRSDLLLITCDMSLVTSRKSADDLRGCIAAADFVTKRNCVPPGLHALPGLT